MAITTPQPTLKHFFLFFPRRNNMASCSLLDTNCSLRPWRFFFLSPPSHSKMFQVIYFLFHLRCLSVAHVLSVSCTVFNPLWRRRWRFFTSSLVPTLMSRSYQNLFVCLRVSFPLLIFFSFVMFFFSGMGHLLRIGHDDAILRNVFFLSTLQDGNPSSHWRP